MDKVNPIGRKVRTYREEKGLSLEALAAKAGCSEEYLEWLEEGQVEPSVALLISLAKALHLNSTAFIKMDEAPERRLEEEAKRTQHYSYKTLTTSNPDSHLMAFHVTIPPKVDHSGVGYQHEGEEFVFVLSGQVEVTVGEDKTLLEPSESLRFNSNIDHHLSNSSDQTTELLVILYVP
jgi:transcriptional regulator with XRE-family HTH domain